MIIEIFTLDKFDKESFNITSAFKKYGGKSDIKFSKLYNIFLTASSSYFKKVADEILLDSIVESYSIFKDSSLYSFKSSLIIDIWFKDSVTDIVGESVKLAIRDGGFKEPDCVRTAKRFYFFNFDKNAFDFIMEDYANELIHKVNVKRF